VQTNEMHNFAEVVRDLLRKCPAEEEVVPDNTFYNQKWQQNRHLYGFWQWSRSHCAWGCIKRDATSDPKSIFKEIIQLCHCRS